VKTSASKAKSPEKKEEFKQFEPVMASSEKKKAKKGKKKIGSPSKEELAMKTDSQSEEPLPRETAPLP